MSDTTDLTTLVSLFHTPENARRAIADLAEAGIPDGAIQILGGEASQTSAPEQSLAALKTLNLPDKDLQVLAEGLKGGGTLIIVRAAPAFADEAENILERYDARQIDERTSRLQPDAGAATATGDIVIPVVEEALAIGKRKVERGGVRVFSRIVETPFREQVVLREEHATIQRYPVDRAVSAAELDSLRDQTLELRQFAEEAVVSKTARVVEEVSIGQEARERSQQVRDTLRKTEIEIDQIVPDNSRKN
jgi:uncharacterized protein (TIGR02271 family)